MGWINQRGSQVLPRNECLRLLAVHAGGVGRIAVVDAGHAVIEPVNYRMLDQDILLQIGPGLMLDAVDRQSIVAFEIDGMIPPEAWSVGVRGLARRLDRPAVAGHARPVGVGPVVPQPGTSLVVIRTDVVTGRRFPLQPSGFYQSSVASRRARGGEPESRVRVPRDAMIREAAAVMDDERISSVLLGDHRAWLVGEHDLIEALAAGLDPTTPAADVATRTPLWATTTTTVAEAAAIMAKHCVQHLLVMTADGAPVGVLAGARRSAGSSKSELSRRSTRPVADRVVVPADRFVVPARPVGASPVP